MKLKKNKRNNIVTILLSVISAILNIASMFVSAYMLEVATKIGNGITIASALYMALQNEKLRKTICSSAPFLIKTLPKIVISTLIKNKEIKGKMKNLLKNVFTCLKNNVGTSVMIVIELIVGAAIEYLFNQFISRDYSPISIIIMFVIGIIVIGCIILTAYIGGDSKAFALIRKVIKKLGDDKSLKALDNAYENYIQEKQQEENIRKMEEEKRKKDEEIYAKILAEEEAEKDRIIRAKIEAYKTAHNISDE